MYDSIHYPQKVKLFLSDPPARKGSSWNSDVGLNKTNCSLKIIT